MTLHEEFESVKGETLAILNKVKDEKRSMTDDEKTAYNAGKSRLLAIEEIAKEEKQLKALEVANDSIVIADSAKIEIEDAIVNFSKNKKENTNMEKNENEIDPNVIEQVKLYGRLGNEAKSKKEFTLTSGTSGITMPRGVSYNAVALAGNAFRQGFAALGVPTMSSSNTDNWSVDFLNDSSNTANNDQEGATSGVNADAASAAGSLDLVEYHSKAQWFSKKLTNAYDFDVTQYAYPMALNRVARKEEADWAALLIADTSIIGKTTASTTAVTYAELVDWDESTGVGYDPIPKFVLVSKALKSILRKIVDSTGQPILTKSGNDGLDYLFNKPLITCSSLEVATAGKVVGAIVPAESVIIRDTTSNELVRYEGESIRPGQVGFEAIGWSAFAYSTAAIRTLKMAAS